jgi:hypothetical protein
MANRQEHVLNMMSLGKLQIKTMWYDCTHIEMDKTQKRTVSNCGDFTEQQEFSFVVGRNSKWFISFARQFGSLSESNIVLPFDSVVMPYVFTQLS